MDTNNAERLGVTLLELIVVLALLGVMAGVTTMAFHHVPSAAELAPWTSALVAARSRAIDSGRTITLRLIIARAAHSITVLPDGSVIADSDLHVDRLSGTPSHAPVRR